MSILLRFKLLLLPLVFVGCNKNDEGPHDGVLRICTQWNIPSLHPHFTNIDINCRTFQKALYEGLTRIDSKGVPQLAGAESLSISEDQTTYRFTLREMYWTNGDLVTAYDFERSWKHALKPKSICYRSDLFYVLKNGQKAKLRKCSLDEVGVYALDASTLEVVLERPLTYFLDLVANSLFSPIWHQDLDENEPKVFNGPFTIQTWKKGESLTLEKNATYWDHGHVSLDQVEILVVHDAMTTLMLYEKGKCDWIGRPLTFIPDEALVKLKETGELFAQDILGYFWLSLNTEVATLKNTLIRKALSLALDRDEIAHRVTTDRIAAAHLIPRPEETNPFHAEKARALFLAGLREMGLTPETFPPLEIIYTSVDAYKRMAEFIQEQWQNTFGIQVRLRRVSPTLLVHSLSEGEFEVGGIGWFTDFNHPIQLLEFFERPDHPYNTSRWEDAHFTTLLEKVHTTQQGLEEAESYLLEQMPMIPLYQERFHYLIKPYVQGFYMSPLGLIDFKNIALKYRT